VEISLDARASMAAAKLEDAIKANQKRPATRAPITDSISHPPAKANAAYSDKGTRTWFISVAQIARYLVDVGNPSGCDRVRRLEIIL